MVTPERADNRFSSAARPCFTLHLIPMKRINQILLSGGAPFLASLGALAEEPAAEKLPVVKAPAKFTNSTSGSPSALTAGECDIYLAMHSANDVG